MRIGIGVIPVVLLLLWPILVSAFELPVWAALVGLLVIGIVRQGLASPPKPGPQRMILNTICISHYVEKVRWCMDYLGVQYEEVPDVGILGVLLAGRMVPTLHLRPFKTEICDSPVILRYLYGRYCDDPERDASFLRPTAEIVELERRLDAFGSHIRVWLYTGLMPHAGLLCRIWGSGEKTVPLWQRCLLWPFFPILRLLLSKVLRLNPKNAAACLVKAKALITELDERLSDGRPYLMGEQLTYVDFTWGALCAPIAFVGSDNYAGGIYPGTYLALEDIPVKLRPEVEDLMGHPSVEFVRRLYKQHRKNREEA